MVAMEALSRFLSLALVVLINHSGLSWAYKECYDGNVLIRYCSDDEYCCSDGYSCCDSSSLPAGAIIGIVFGVLIFAIIIGICLRVLILKNVKPARKVNTAPRNVTVQHQPPPPQPQPQPQPQFHPQPQFQPQYQPQPLPPPHGQPPMYPPPQPMYPPPQNPAYPPPTY